MYKDITMYMYVQGYYNLPQCTTDVTVYYNV